MYIPADPHKIKVGDLWVDADVRNTDRGKTGRAKPKFRTVKILSEPTLRSPGSFEIVKAPKAPHTIGKVRSFTRDKLVNHYVKVS